MDVTAPLLVSADPLLVADVQRLCAAAGVVPEVVRDSTHAMRLWAAAPVVLVGDDCAPALAAASPPRRQRVHVLGRAPVADDLFREALGVVDSIPVLDCDARSRESVKDVLVALTEEVLTRRLAEAGQAAGR